MPSEDKVIWVIAFNGKQVNWTMWEEKFLAKANIKGYRKILLGKEIALNDEEDCDENTLEGREKKRLHDANTAAYKDLVLSIDESSTSGCVVFNLVHLSKTKPTLMELHE